MPDGVVTGGSAPGAGPGRMIEIVASSGPPSTIAIELPSGDHAGKPNGTPDPGLMAVTPPVGSAIEIAPVASVRTIRGGPPARLAGARDPRLARPAPTAARA